MADHLSPDERHALMSRIRSKNTQPELLVRRLLHGLGYRYVLHDKRLPGKPDLVFPSRRKIICVHGCFWHGHDCGRGFKPATNADFWLAKIAANQVRDARHAAALNEAGWQVLTVWECETKAGQMAALERKLVAFLESTA